MDGGGNMLLRSGPATTLAELSRLQLRQFTNFQVLLEPGTPPPPPADPASSLPQAWEAARQALAPQQLVTMTFAAEVLKARAWLRGDGSHVTRAG